MENVTKSTKALAGRGVNWDATHWIAQDGGSVFGRRVVGRCLRKSGAGPSELERRHANLLLWKVESPAAVEPDADRRVVNDIDLTGEAE